MVPETLSYPNLIAGNFPRQTGKVIIAAGADLQAGAILGKILYGVSGWMTRVIHGDDNVGNGSVGFSGVGPDIKLGNYLIECTGETPDAGTFSVRDPDGAPLANLTVGVSYDNDHFSGQINDGSVDWAIGDKIIFSASPFPGSGKFVLCDGYATDGSDDPVAVLAEDAGAAAADIEAVAYFTGSFNAGAVSLADGTSVSDVKAALEARNIYLVEADNNVNV